MQLLIVALIGLTIGKVGQASKTAGRVGMLGGEVATADRTLAITNAGSFSNATRSASVSDIFQYRKLATKLAKEEAASVFTAGGKLTNEALVSSKVIVRELNNPNVPAGFSKYTTQVHRCPSGGFQVHFYMNPKNGEVWYNLDYKSVFTRKN